MVDKVPQGFFRKSALLYSATRSLRHYLKDRVHPVTTAEKLYSWTLSGSQFGMARRYGKFDCRSCFIVSSSS